ncbi:Dual-specificity RNA methyltransferase RlmN [bacterium HR40]|nr:Dual-specificity RNA methyltransferase RlmN [bacterium HR40]
MPARNPETPSGKISPVGLETSALERELAALGVPERQLRMRSSQIRHWLYVRGARDLAEMTDLPLALREVLGGRLTLERPTVVCEQCSADGTRKWLLQFADGQKVETVFIPEEDRGALCVSSQVGCTLSCRFCHTGTMPLVRNLSAAEILAQILVARDRLGEWPATRPGRRLTNVVLMGMGEPLFNYDNVLAALRVMVDPDGLGFSKRRVTVSTSGVVPKIDQLGRDLPVALAISLHAVRDELRDQLVPLNRKWNIASLLDACRRYPIRRRITFEYVMLRGVNDSDADARELVRLLHDIPAKVNLIPFNPWPGAPFECSSNNRIRAFAAIVEAGGIAAPIRTPRGRDILAACGQLRTEAERRRRTAAAAAA